MFHGLETVLFKCRVSSHSKRLVDRKRQCDEQPQAKKVCPRKLEFEDSIETCVDFSADVASVNHDHSYFCIEEQATPTICCPGCSRGGGICPNFLPYPRGFSMYLSRQLWQMPLGARGSTPRDGRWYPHYFKHFLLYWNKYVQMFYLIVLKNIFLFCKII